MSRIFISIFFAIFIAGSFLWLPWQQVQADRAYLQAVVISSTSGSVVNAEQEDSRPEFYRRQYTPRVIAHIEKSTAEEKDETEEVIQTETNLENTAALGDLIVAEAPVSKKEVVALPKPKQQEVSEPETVSEQTETVPDGIRKEIFQLLNKERAELGFEPLTLDSSLNALATAHSEDMATKNYLAHKNQNGCNLTCRVEAAGYKALAWAENIVYLENEHLLSTEETAEEMMDSWMGSGGHRKNIQNGDYTHVGIGVARNGNKVYVTTDFALPK